MVPLVGNIFTICTNLITNGTIGKEIGTNGTKVPLGEPRTHALYFEKKKMISSFKTGSGKEMMILVVEYIEKY